MKKTSKKVKKSFSEKLRGDTVFHVGSRENVLMASVPYTSEDFKNSLLIVSLLINLFFLIGWLLAQVSTVYAVEIARFITG